MLQKGQQKVVLRTRKGEKNMEIAVIVVYVVIIGAFMYFMSIRPQKKQQKQMETLWANMEPGDSVVTTSGFYGTILDVMDDTVIVEFGNNKNCRIPMQKQAIAQIEKANGTSVEEKK